MQEEITIKNPFPGLRPFDTSESRIFFGRDGLSDNLLEKLRATRFVAVVGTSGSGKSSLVKAGLLPALTGGFLKGAGSAWRIALFRPVNNPIGNLAQALAEADLFRPDGEEQLFDERRGAIEKALRRSSLGLIEVVRQAKMSHYENLLIVVDQFEELYRFEPSPEVEHPKEEASAFVKLLLEATQEADLPIYVILTMRSDYLGESAHFWGLPEAINKGQFLIPRMDDDEKREAIEGPIRVFDAKISSPLVNRLLNDVGDDPGQLPILQHALMRTWEYRFQHKDDSESLGLKHYENPKVGGMARALSLHADEAYGELTDAQKVIAEKMFKRLTEKGAGKREGRLPATVGEIAEIAGIEEKDILPVIEAFRKEGRSFLMPPPPIDSTSATDLTSATLIDISHESLISGWSRLSGWVDEEADSAKIYTRLIDDALRHPKETGLLTNPELEFALKWRTTQKPNPVWARRYRSEFGKALDGDNPPVRPAWAQPNNTEYDIAIRYLDLSKKEHDRLEKRKERQQLRYLIYVSTAAMVLFILLVTTSILWGSARNERANAEAARLRAEDLRRQAEQIANTNKTLKEQADYSAEQADKAKTVALNKQAEALIAKDAAQAAAAEANRLRAEAFAAGNTVKRLAERGNLLEQGIISAFSGDTRTVIDSFEHLAKIYGERSDTRSKVAPTEILIGDAILRSEGDRANNKVKSEEAIKHYKNALTISQAGGVTLDPSVWIGIGDRITNSSLASQGIGVPYYAHGIELMEGRKDTKPKVDALIKLAGANDLAKKTQAAEKAYSEARSLARKSGNSIGEGAALMGLGDIYLYQKEPDQAAAFYNQADAVYHIENPDSATFEALIGSGRAQEGLGQIYQEQKTPKEARAAYQLALKRYQSALRNVPKDGETDRIEISRIRLKESYLRYVIRSLRPPISDLLLETINASGIDSAVKQYRDLKTNHYAEYDFSESPVNSLGYVLLRNNKAKEAIEIFKLNVEAYPKSFNVFDSLGEAYMTAGDKELAIINYEKSLKLNPENKAAVEALKKLRGQ